jgi:predicted anti-sigma-YlaC factor YlaD
VSFSDKDCARARESISAQLDGELPELELEWQRGHLRICADCSAWAEDVESATEWLREAPWETPAIGFARPRVRRARGTASAALVAAAAASVVAVLGSFHSLTLGSSEHGSSSGVLLQGSAPALASLEVQRLGLPPLQARVSTGIVQSRLRAV